MPRPHFPVQPLHPPIVGFEAVFVRRDYFARKRALVRGLPVSRHRGKDVVVRPSVQLRLSRKSTIAEKAATDGEVAHLPVEHRDRSGGLLDKYRQSS